MTNLAKAAKFMDNNLAYESPGATVTYSSDEADAAANLPDENLSKVWEPSGNWEVNDDNNMIYAGGLSGMLTNGNYTSSELIAEIESGLELLEGDAWTITYASNKFTIKYDLSNSGGSSLDFSSQSNAIWKDIGFNDEIDTVVSPGGTVTGFSVYSGLEWIEIDFGSSAHELGFFSLMGPHNEDFSLSDGAVVKVKLDNNPDNWESPAVENIVTPTKRGIFHFIDESDCFYRYARMEIKDQKNPDMKFSYFYGGDYIPITARNVSIGYQKARVDPSRVQETESGRRYFNIKDSYEQWNSLTMQFVPRENRLDLEQMWHDFGRHKPFFISIDPTANISNDLGELTRFVYFNSQVIWQHQIRDLYNGIFSVRDVV